MTRQEHTGVSQSIRRSSDEISPEPATPVGEPIAIVGVACRFPGAANQNAYWELLRDGRDAIREVPANRSWDKSQYYSSDPDAAGKMYTWEGGFLDEYERFDAAFFGISPREAALMDPQQRILLETVWEALEDAGQAPSRLEGTATGVFVGISTNDFLQIGCRFGDPLKIDPHSGTGSANSVASGRISFCLGLQGPNFPVDTACSSSLVALHLACQSLRSHECRTAVIAAVNLMLSPETSVYFCKVKALARDGRCKAFDAAANGYGRSEGAGAVVVKRLSDARADGDRILAIVRGTAVNHDGRTTGLTVPNGDSQERLIRQALSNAGLAADQVSYVEAHGTGTPLGDPIEFRALRNTYCQSRDPRHPLLVGSAKTNIGHTEAAAGIAGLIKVVLSLRNQKLPPHLHFNQPNPYIAWGNTPLEIVTTLRDWEPIDGRRIAGLSSFGFSGTNAHVILEGVSEDDSRMTGGESEEIVCAAELLTVSAKTRAALHENLSQIRNHLDRSESRIGDLAYTLAHGRSHFQHRWSCVAETRSEAITAIDSFLDRERSSESSRKHSRASRSSTKIAWMFGGQGGQAWGMGRELFDTWPVFRQQFELCDSIVKSESGVSIIDLIYRGTSRPFESTLAVHSSLFAVEYALGRLWQSWGVTPMLVFGHSLGEFVAAVFAGILSLEDSLRFVVKRAQIVDDQVEPGRMTAVAADAGSVEQLILREKLPVSIAAVNSPRVTVVAASIPAMAEFCSRLDQARIPYTEAPSVHAFHSPAMDGILSSLRSIAESMEFRPPRIGFLAASNGQLSTQEVAKAEYWVQQIRVPVQFSQSIQTLTGRDYDVCLEINSAPILTRCAQQCTSGESDRYIASLQGGGTPLHDLMVAAAELYRHRIDFNWKNFSSHRKLKLISAPTYAFQRESLAPMFDPTGHRVPSTAPRAVRAEENGALEDSPQDVNHSPSEQSGSPETEKRIQPGDCVFRLEWQELNPDTSVLPNESSVRSDVSPSASGSENAWLIVHQNEDDGFAAIVQRLSEEGVRYHSLRLPSSASGSEGKTIAPGADDSRLEHELLTLSERESSWGGILFLTPASEMDLEAVSGDAVMAFAEAGSGELLKWIQICQRRPLPGDPRWIVVTQGVFTDCEQTDDPSAEFSWLNASTWGLGRVLAVEQPQWRCQFVDLDPTRSAGSVERLIRLMENAIPEDQIRISGDRCYSRRLVRDLNRSQRELSGALTGDGSYLITGGLGGLGLLLAEQLIAMGARSIRLLGRTAPGEAAREQMLRWTQSGIDVQFRPCDVTDAVQVEEVFAACDREKKAVRGIFHLAGTLDDDYLSHLNWERFSRVLRPKIMGAWNLHRATLTRSVDYFVCFSSIASVFGGLKQGNYAAANAWLDQLMEYRRRLALPALSINWGPWEEAGMASRLGNRQFQGWASVGIQVLPTAVAFHDFQKCLNSAETQIVFVPVEWSRALQFFPPGLEPPLFRRMAISERKQIKPSKHWEQVCSDLVRLPTSEHYDSAVNYVESHVSEVLGVPGARRLDTQVGFVEQGMDSLMAIDLRSRLQVDLGLIHILPVSFVIDYPTLDRMARYYTQHIFPRVSSQSTAPPEQVTPQEQGSQTKDDQTFHQIPLDVLLKDEPPYPVLTVPSLKVGEHKARRVSTAVAAATSASELPGEPVPIAVIGMSCRFPDGITSPERYWESLIAGKDAIVEVPRSRWDVAAWYDPDPEATGKINCRYGGFINDVETFDAAFFGISPREALRMDPQHRMLLELTVEALEDALVPIESLSDSNTAVAVGISGNDYLSVLRRANDISLLDGWLAMGNALSIAAGRISHVFGWHGPCTVLDTACSSSLAAIYTACMHLRNRQTDLALAGGSNLILGPEISISLTKAHALSRDGRCKTFDASANGYVRSEGMAMLALKRLDDAIRDGNPVHAVIHGIAMNHDGHSSGLTVPNVAAQESLIRNAVLDAGLQPGDIDYLEAHGTGTPLGDPIEMQAIGRVFGSDRSHELRVGSVKANLGHLEAAAGIAGIMKVILALRHRTIPPQLHFRQPSPVIPWNELSVRIPVQAEKWPESDRPRFAGVSSFGFSGTNLHIVLGDSKHLAEKSETVDPTSGDGRLSNAADSPAGLLCISSKTDSALRELAQRYVEFLDRDAAIDFGDVCYSANIGRSQYASRLIVVASGARQAGENISLWLNGRSSANVQQKMLDAGRTPKLAFLFTGQGSQYVSMGRQLLQTQPVFRRSMIACDSYLREHYSLPLLDLLYGDASLKDPQLIDRTSIAQPALYSLGVSLADLWTSWGIRPNAVLGHSLGEFAAAYVAGVFTREEGLMLTAERGALMDSVSTSGSMAVVFAPRQFVESAIQHRRLPVSVAAANGPLNTVVSGASDAIDQILRDFNDAGVQSKRLTVSQAFHSELMECIQPEFLKVAERVDFRPPVLGMISNISGDFVQNEIATPQYWVDHIRKPVLFADGLRTLHQRNYRTFLEIGPDATLVGMGRQIFHEDGTTWIAAMRRQTDSQQQLLRALGTLALNGVPIDWNGYYQGSNHRKVALPKYAFQRKRFWPVESDAVDTAAAVWPGAGVLPGGVSSTAVPGASALSKTEGNGRIRQDDLLVGRRFESSAFRGTIFEKEFSIESPAFLKEHVLHSMVVVPGAAYLSMTTAALSHDYALPFRLKDVSFPEPLFLNENEHRQVQVVLNYDDRNQEQFRIFSRATDETSAQWRLHAGGLIQATLRTSGDPLNILRIGVVKPPSQHNAVSEVSDLNAIQGRCSEHFPDTRLFYDIMARTGVELGASFRWNAEVWRCDGESLSHMMAPSELSNWPVDRPHPGLVDSCIQSAAFSIPKTAHDFNAYIPVQVQQFTVHRDVSNELWCHCRLTEDMRDTNGSYLFDVRVFDTSGQTVIEFHGLRLQRAPRTALAAFAQRRLRDWMYRIDWVPQQPDHGSNARIDGKWILFTDAIGIGEKVSEKLADAGADYVIVSPHSGFEKFSDRSYGISPEKKEDFQKLLSSVAVPGAEQIRGIVYLWPVNKAVPSLDLITPERFEAAQRVGVHALLNLLQAIGSVQLRTPPQLLIATRKTQSVGRHEDAVDVDQAGIWGFCRVASQEFPHMKMVRIDLDSDSTPDADAHLISTEMTASGEEDQVAWRGQERYVARLMKGMKSEAKGEQEVGPEHHEPYRLVKSDVNSIEKLTFQLANRMNPSLGEVEIAVRATGLNFRDVLNVLGLYPGEAGPLGFECAGTIKATGPDIKHLSPGDRVIAIAPGAIGPFVLTDARLVVPMPKEMSFEEGATVPIVFLTVEIALCQMGQLKKGDTLLIHSAAGGVGLSAIQAAKAVGAKIVATAGTEAKRDYLRQLGIEHVFDSRSMDFANHVLAVTENRGVDIVLNALPGEYVAQSLACLAPNGRFVEIGKSNTWEEERWGQRRADVNYIRFALDELAVNMPSMLGDEFLKLIRKFEQGIYSALPLTEFDIRDVKEAFRYMAQARHIGKVIVRQDEFRHKQGDNSRVRSDGTYLITGGLGGIGMLSARWLADRGAKNIVLVSRRSPDDEARRMIGEMTRSDIKVHTMSVDLSSESQVADMMREISEKCPPLRGIIHGAGILDDGVVLQQDWSRFEKVMRPKTLGMIHLHNLTRHLPLDWFMVYSSIASLWGSPGQANYAAANAVLDAFSTARRSAGLPTLAINWGPWAEVGMAAKMDSSGRHWWEVVGIGMIPPAQGIAIQELLLQEDASQTAILPIDWARLISQLPQGAAPPLIRELIRNQSRRLEPSREWLAFVAELTAAPPTERIDMLVQHTCEEAARILGLDSAAEINPHLPLKDLGFDSLMAVELANHLTSATGISLPMTLMFDYPTLYAISGYIVRSVLMLDTGEVPEQSVEKV